MNSHHSEGGNQKRRFRVLLPVLLLVASFSAGSLLLSTRQSPQPTKRQAGVGFAVTLEAPIPGDKILENEAVTRLPFPLPRLTYVPGGGDLAEIWVSPLTVPITERSLALVFEGHVTFIAHQAGKPLNYQRLLAQEPDLPFVLIQVNGVEGMGTNPGDQNLPDGTLWHYPGSVEWQREDLVLTVYGEYPLEELIKVAESVQ